jgi:predicted ATP-dependent serine protease
MKSDLKKYYECAACQQKYREDVGRCWECQESMMRVVLLSDEKSLGYDPFEKPEEKPQSQEQELQEDKEPEDKEKEEPKESIEGGSTRPASFETDSLADYYANGFPIDGWDAD